MAVDGHAPLFVAVALRAERAQCHNTSQAAARCAARTRGSTRKLPTAPSAVPEGTATARAESLRWLSPQPQDTKK